MRSLILCLVVLNLSLVANQFSLGNQTAQSEFAMELNRFQEPGGKEAFFVYCPPGAKKKSLCKVSKEDDGIEVMQAEVTFEKIYDAIDKFLKQLPPSDVVGRETSAPLYQIGDTSLLWRVKAGKRWSVGSISHSETIHPGGVATRRMKAIASIEWRFEDWFQQELRKRSNASQKK